MTISFLGGEAAPFFMDFLVSGIVRSELINDSPSAGIPAEGRWKSRFISDLPGFLFNFGKCSCFVFYTDVFDQAVHIFLADGNFTESKRFVQNVGIIY